MKMRKKNTKPPSSRLNPQTKIGSVPKASQRSLLASNARKPRILWVNAYCLLDTSSGASISVRQILHQLQSNGYDVNILGATNFDSLHGAAAIKDRLSSSTVSHGELLKIKDGALTHHLVKTRSIIRDQMTTGEVTALYSAYVAILHAAKPDLVFFYGGQITDFLIPHEARVRGIPSAAYLVNANYRNSRWCRDVDLIITDTHATAKFYAENEGFEPVPVGKFIDLGKVIAKEHERKHATLINPSWSKGAGIVAMLAVLLEEKRPDIMFEVVESRGSWEEVVRSVTREVWRSERTELKNVVVTPNADDISEVYKRSRIVLGLSQWWESGSRVLAEAMLNGIPAMVSNHGGSPEMVGDGGIIVNLPPSCHHKPFTSMPRPENLNELVNFLERVWDDEPFYLNLMVRALQQGSKLHRMEVSTQRLLEAFHPLVEKRAGDGDFSDAVKKVHKHGLEERGASSSVKTNDASVRSTANVGSVRKLENKDNAAAEQCWNVDCKNIKSIAFFWVGGDLAIPTHLVKSINHHCEFVNNIIQISDLKTSKVRGVDKFFQLDLPSDIMSARLIAYASLEEQAEELLFVDADTLFLSDPTIRIDFRKELGLNRRNTDFFMNDKWPEYYPEFTGRKASDVMPYLFDLIYYSGNGNPFSEMLEICQRLPSRFHRWYGDQVALKVYAETFPEKCADIANRDQFMILEDMPSPEEIQKFYREGVFALTFKGPTAKTFIRPTYELISKLNP